jgi:hypothetical protein
MERTSQCEVELPPLAVTALVPVILPLVPTPNDDPLSDHDPEDGDEGLDVEDDDEGGGNEPVEEAEEVPVVLPEVGGGEDVELELAEDLGSGDGGDGPVGGGEAGDEDVDDDEDEVGDDEELGLALVEGLAEGGGGIAGGIVLESGSETNGLTTSGTHPGRVVLIEPITLAQRPGTHDRPTTDANTREENATICDHRS